MKTIRKYSCHKIVYCFLLGVIFSVFPCKGHSQSNKDQPNIILIMTDDLGYGDIGVFFQNQRKQNGVRSEPWMATPHLDKMAQEGVMLTNHYSAAPVCAPSRSSLLSGLSQGHANVRNNQFDKALADNYTLGNVMQMAGYKTAAIGKWGLQGDKRYSEDGDAWKGKPTNRGFDYYYGYIRHRDGHEHYPEEGIYRGKKEVYENELAITDGLDKCYTTDLWTAAAKRWITTTQKATTQPFFMFLAYDTPHAVLEVPTQAYPKGGGLKGGLQWLGQKGNMINTASGTPDTFIHPDYARATYDHDNNPQTVEVAWPDTYKRYATMVRRIDNAVGDLIQLLKDLGIDDNTLLVFTSDNGPSKESYLPKDFVANTPDFFNSFGPFDGIKRDLLEGGERLPLIARWPDKIKAGTVVETPSITYDWLPTFIEAAGLPAPAYSDGISLLPDLTGIGEREASLIYSEYVVGGKTPDYDDFSANNRNRSRKQMQMIRKGPYVAIRYDIQSADDNFEIYDITKDTHQSINLAKTESLQSIQQWMKEKVLQVRRPDSTAKRPYDGTPVPSEAVTATRPGLEYKTYTSYAPWLPITKGLNPKSSGTTDNLKAIKKLRKDKVLVAETLLKIPATGTYTITLSNPGKAVVKIHEALLFDTDYKQPADQEIKAEITLEKGFHPITIYHQPNTGKRPSIDMTLQLGAQAPPKKPMFYIKP